MFRLTTLSTVTLGAVMLITLTNFASAGPEAVQPAATPFKIGSLKAYALSDAKYVVPNDGSIFGSDSTTDAVTQALKAAGAPTDTITLSVSALLLEDGKYLVLLDTGLGPSAQGALLKSLAKAGFSPSDVTDVLITHSHGDHVGGLAKADDKPAFPKATVHMAAAEWDYMKSKSDQAALVLALTSQVKTFEPGTTVLPGIKAIAVKGHTPGHMSYEIVSGTDRLLDIGDSAHSSILSLAKPEWAMQFDTDRALAKKSRETLLHDLSASHETVFSPHFPYPGVGRIVVEGDHYSWQASLTAKP